MSKKKPTQPKSKIEALRIVQFPIVKKENNQIVGNVTISVDEMPKGVFGLQPGYANGKLIGFGIKRNNEGVENVLSEREDK